MITFAILVSVIATIAWTVTKEEVFREPREYCVDRSKKCVSIMARKFFYLFTCEYCFSHYVSAGVVLASGYRLGVADGFVGFAITVFALVWAANWSMSLFALLRQSVKLIGMEAKLAERKARQRGAL